MKVSQCLRELSLHTVCEEARCPNRTSCWNAGTATFLILGSVCTRNCAFCAIQHGRPAPPDDDEPGRVAAAAAQMGLRHVIITSVTRDDLDDGGASHYVKVLKELAWRLPDVTVEVLVPDFRGETNAVDMVLEQSPDVFNHNLETVERLQSQVRPAASYERSLRVLAHAARSGNTFVKSGLMLGLGESEEEVYSTLRDLRSVGCDLLTLGQYLAPSRTHFPVKAFVTPERFDAYARFAYKIGFRGVVSAPLARSSYRAADLFQSLQARCR